MPQGVLTLRWDTDRFGEQSLMLQGGDTLQQTEE